MRKKHCVDVVSRAHLSLIVYFLLCNSTVLFAFVTLHTHTHSCHSLIHLAMQNELMQFSTEGLCDFTGIFSLIHNHNPSHVHFTE